MSGPGSRVPETPWHTFSVEHVLEAERVSAQRGLGPAESGVSLTGLVPDIATIGVLLNRNVRGWCFGWPVVMDRDGREWYAPGPRQGPGIFGS
jgi:hypothetical protein